MKKKAKNILVAFLVCVMLISTTASEGLAVLLNEIKPVYEMGEIIVGNKEIKTKKGLAKAQAQSPDVTLLVGDSTELFVNVKDSDGNPVTNAPLKWTASPSGVVSLTQGSDTRYATITGLSSKNSPVTVTATLGSSTKTAVIEVLDKDVSAPDGTTVKPKGGF